MASAYRVPFLRVPFAILRVHHRIHAVLYFGGLLSSKDGSTAAQQFVSTPRATRTVRCRMYRDVSASSAHCLHFPCLSSQEKSSASCTFHSPHSSVVRRGFQERSHPGAIRKHCCRDLLLKKLFMKMHRLFLDQATFTTLHPGLYLS